MFLHAARRFCVFLSCSSLLHVVALPFKFNFKTSTTATGLEEPKEFTFEKALGYLTRFAYYGSKNPDPLMRKLSKKDPDKAAKIALGNFQRFADLPVTKQLDNNTIRVMQQSRCAMEDLVAPGGRKKRAIEDSTTVMKGTQWAKKLLTYTVKNYPEHFFHFSAHHKKLTDVPTQKEVRSAIKKAFQVWSSVSKLKFKEVKRKADIVLSFVKRDHGDGYPFDGPRTVLAHAFYPVDGGDVHFDDNEAYTVNRKDKVKIDIYKLATHEIGHSLGLYHVNDKKSIMYPIIYIGEKFKLTDGDIANIRYLYN